MIRFLILRYFFISLLLLAPWNFAGAFQEPGSYFEEDIQKNTFDEKKWESATRGLDYSVMEEPAKKEKESKALKDNAAFITGLISSLKWFFIVLAAGILLWLVFLIMKESGILSGQSKTLKPIGETISLEQIEENIYDADLDAYILKALENGQYQIVIRLYYLAILKELSLKAVILWKKNKTNKVYLREMQDHILSSDFRHTTQLFERVWYGGNTISQQAFTEILPAFKDLRQSVRSLPAPVMAS